MVASAFICLAAAAGPVAAAEAKSDDHARSAIFGQSTVDVLELRRQTAGMSAEQRFERLRDVVRVYRKHYVHAGGRQEQLVQAAVYQRRGERIDYDVPASPPEESTSGRMWLARRGSQLFFLYAEADSSQFRLIHSQEIDPAATRAGGVRLVVESHKSGGMCEVDWKGMTIRAESGPAAPWEGE